ARRGDPGSRGAHGPGDRHALASPRVQSPGIAMTAVNQPEIILHYSRGRGSTRGNSAIAFGGGFPLLLALLARGVARVALELLLIVQPLGFFPLALKLGLARERFEPQLLLAGRLLGGAARRLLRLAFGLAPGALRVAHLPGLENFLPPGLALDDRRVGRIVFRIREELLRHLLARLGGGGLAVSKAVAVHERHCIPRERESRSKATDCWGRRAHDTAWGERQRFSRAKAAAARRSRGFLYFDHDIL